ncbi:MAG: YjgP/YjgQ family permease [Chlorobi bacterium]|nr:MAG: YjgP/YjgQ family permease [Bacteroidota bacterium]KXK32612.1 MAG: permease YjgP/YjgQ family protein [Chlorobi bacterium OLB6]MBE2265488.1 LptF/LptG family permease [Flavobacteriales bacterium]MBL1162004.1 YjgP/YjgQ family permease [Chlorobiota bacterium]MBW7854425.1 LptF/LptG family permease [Candidatus Kapabacteria bacterium]MCC6331695.1 LptF/LptG family permease [Ignavibacteria bacterium]
MILLWYTVRRFLSTIAFAVIALCVLFVIIDLIENLAKFIDKGVPFGILAWYYIVYIPDIAKLLIPVACLLAALFVVGRMASTNEVTAMKAAGISTIRFLIPFLIVGMLISVAQVWFSGWVVPNANSAKLHLVQTSMGGGGTNVLQNLYFRDTSNRNVHIGTYNEEQLTAYNVVVEDFTDSASVRLVWRMEAATMYWNPKLGWIAPSARIRSFNTNGMNIRWERNWPVPFTVRYNQIARLQLSVSELTFDQVHDYIETLRKGGKNTRRQEIDYYAGWAFPFSSLIVILLAVPIAARRRKAGIAVNIAIAMVITFFYIAFSEISKSVGAGTQADPLVIAWSANMIFFLLGLVSLAVFRR